MEIKEYVGFEGTKLEKKTKGAAKKEGIKHAKKLSNEKEEELDPEKK